MVYWSWKRTPPQNPDATTASNVKALLDVVIHFFPGTRWERTFFIVDSKYHFTPKDSVGDNELAP